MGDDTLTVDTSFGNLIPANGLNFDGGGGKDGLAVKAKSSNNGSYVPGDLSTALTNEGTVFVDNLPINFARIGAIDTAGFGNFAINPSGANANINVVDGKNLTAGISAIGANKSLNASGFATDPINGGLVSITPIAIWNVGTLSINAPLEVPGFINWLTIAGDGTAASGANVKNLSINSGGYLNDNLLWLFDIKLDGSLTADSNGDVLLFNGNIDTQGPVTIRATRAFGGWCRKNMSMARRCFAIGHWARPL